MPPNLLVKAAFVRGELESIDEPTCEEKEESIRTDFILQNIYAYMLKSTYEFDEMHAKNKKEEYVLKELEKIINDVLFQHGEDLRVMCLDLVITEDTIGSIIIGISHVLFSEGLTWSRIITLIVFIGELMLLCLSRNFHERIVYRIHECFCRFVKEELEDWIYDHGGWEGLLVLSSGNTNSSESSKSGWAKNLLYSTVRMIGTLAQFVNSSNTLP